jgi:hypothetical protein
MRGRPRKYVTDADRQRAYRQRNVAELEEENTRLKARIAELEAARDAATDGPPSEGIIVLE